MSSVIMYVGRSSVIAALLSCALSAAAAPRVAAQAADSTCLVHLETAHFAGSVADLARILNLQDSTSRASFVLQRGGRGHSASTCGPPASVAALGRALGTQPPLPGVRVLPAELLIIGNSAYPREWNEGALWSGRGINAALTAGVQVRWGPLSAAIAPELSWQSNADFDIRLNMDTSRSEFATPLWPEIDLPQRFGTDSFSRIGTGQSFLRMDVRGFGIGISTETMRWGPSRRNPLLLSGTAGGFTHAFIESARPIDVWFGDLELQLFWGRLEESDYFDHDPDNDHRMLAGLLIALHPRVLDGLTIGGGRLQALTWWPELSLTDVVLDPYRGVSQNPTGRSGDNQLIALFFRWATAPAGIEAYGEWAREDHWEEWIGLLRNLDASQAWTLGLQKVIRHGDDAVRVSAEVTHLSDALPIRFAGRGLVAFYTNTSVTQGHTHRGQLLGAPIGPGGESLFLGADYFWAGGRSSLSVERARYQDDFYNMTYADHYGAHARDSEVSIRAGHLVALGGLSLEGQAGWSRRYNRGFLGLDTLAAGETYRRDTNWSLRIGLRWTPSMGGR